VVDFYEDNSKKCCFITLLNKKQLRWDFIEQKPRPVDNSKIQVSGQVARVPYRRLTSQIYISQTGSIYNSETLQVHASLEKNQKPTGVLCSNQDTSNWQISTSDKIYKFTTNSTNLEILFDVSSDTRKSANFSPFEECLYERLNYIFWFTCDGLYRLDSQTLSNLEQIHFLSKDNVVKSVAASSFHIAALLNNGKIVIKSILNDKVTTILNDSKNSKVSSILSSEYYFSTTPNTSILETCQFWGWTQNNSLIMFDGQRAGQQLWKVALSQKNFSRARTLLQGFMDEEQIIQATECIDFAMAEMFLKRRELDVAAEYFAKCKSVDTNLVCMKFLKLEFGEEYLNLEVTKCLLKYLRKKYVSSGFGEDRTSLIVTMIDLYATAISSQFSTTNLQEQQERLSVLRAMRTEFSKLVNSDEISNLLTNDENLLIKIYSHVKKCGDAEMLITVAKSVRDYHTIVESMIQAKFYKEACEELENMESCAVKLALLNKYVLVLYRSKKSGSKSGLYSGWLEDILNLLQNNLEYWNRDLQISSSSLSAEKILAEISDLNQDLTTLETVSKYLKNWDDSNLFGNKTDLLRFTIIKILVHLSHPETHILKVTDLEKYLIHLCFNDSFTDSKFTHLLISSIDNLDSEICSVLIRCSFGHFQEALDKILTNYKLAVDILTKLCEETAAKSVHNWLTVANKAVHAGNLQEITNTTEIANELIGASNGLLHVDDFLPMLDLISDDLKTRLVNQLQITSDQVESKRKQIIKNRSFLDTLNQNFDGFEEENKVKSSIIKYKYQFPCGCGFSNKTQLKRAFVLLGCGGSTSSDCPNCGQLAAMSAGIGIPVDDL